MDVVTGVAVAAVTFAVVLAVGLGGGMAVLFRRRRAAASLSGSSRERVGADAASLEALTREGGGLLVSVDDAVRDADDELGFAIAQFGAERSRGFGDAIAASRAQLAEAFRLRQSLDDSVPESPQLTRQWTLQIIALCTQARETLDRQEAVFRSLRLEEASAGSALAALRVRGTALGSRLAEVRTTLERLRSSYGDDSIADVASNPEHAEQAIAEAIRTMDATAPAVSETGVNAVSGSLGDAERALADAERLLDGVTGVAERLAEAASALMALRESARADLGEAAGARDSAPDADAGRQIIDAMAAVNAALVENRAPRSPVVELETLSSAIEGLDSVLANARNQSERLRHARDAYRSTELAVRSQLTVTRAYIGVSGGGVDARTRLAEAERQLGIAEAQIETDPVDALDVIRRAQTLVRDADALARYRG